MPFANMNPVIPHLWIGGEQTDPRGLGDYFRVIVLAAREIQRGRTYPGIEVWRVPLDDDGHPPTKEEIDLAIAAGEAVAHQVIVGNNVLSTCHMGLNRSALVAGLAMRFLGWEADGTIRKIRSARGPWALSNEWFEQVIREA